MVIGYYALLRANRTLQDAIDAPETDDEKTDSEATQHIGGDYGPIDEETPVSRVELMKANDIAVVGGPDGESVTQGISRFHAALSEMTLRQGIRDEISRYEAMAIALVEPKGPEAGNAFGGFPLSGSPLHYDRFFPTLYQRYEERFVYGAPLLTGITARFSWDPTSPVFEAPLDFNPRVAN
jgi:hypothetical protein